MKIFDKSISVSRTAILHLNRAVCFHMLSIAVVKEGYNVHGVRKKNSTLAIMYTIKRVLICTLRTLHLAE